MLELYKNIKTYRPYILIVIALAMPFLYHIFNYDDRGGLPAYRWGLFFVNLISDLILLMIALGAIVSLIKWLKGSRKSRQGIIDSGARLIIVVLVVAVPKAFNDQQRFGWDEEDLTKTISINIDGSSFLIPVKHLDGTWKKGDDISGLGLVALLPKFEGRPIESKEDFTSNKNGMGKRIRVALDVVESIHPDFLGRFGDLSNKALYLQFNKSQFGVSDETKPISIIYDLNYLGERSGSELHVSAKEGDLTFYLCDKDPLEGEIYFLACETQFPLWGNVVMEYRFSKMYLKDWEEIQNGVFNFVGGMERG